MRLLDRYVLRHFLLAYFYCIASFISIWFIFDVSDNISTFLDERVSRSLIARYYLTQVPQILVILLPVALLLALLFALGRMSRSNEIVSMLTAGVSLPRLVAPLLLVGLVTTAVSTALIRPAPRAGALPGPHRTVPGSPLPDAPGPACASHTMNSPSCSIPACQPRPVPAHQRKNQATEHA